MEGSADSQREGSFRSFFLGFRAGLSDSLLFTGDDHLPVTVVIGSQDDPFAGGADFLDFFIGQADDCSHHPRNLFAAGLHLGCTEGHESECILEADRSCSGKSGELSERVACDHVRGKVFDALCKND